MEEIGSIRAIEVTKMAMDGLMARQQAIAANTANAMTPNYQRKDVAFESQLQNMIQQDNVKNQVKQANSAGVYFSPATLEQVMSQNSFQGFKPELVSDISTANPHTGNNVEIEKEMMKMAKTGTQYTLLAKLENKLFSGLSEVIKGVK